MTVDNKMKSRIKCVQRFGERYYKKHLKKHANQKEDLCHDWWKGLHFWFDRAFYRGRRDEISQKMEKHAFQVLDELLGSNERNREAKLHQLAQKGWLKREQWKDEKNPLQKALMKGEVNNRYDRLLVISTLELLQTLPDNNIITWAIQCIKDGELESVYRRLDELFAVGDKIACLFLRDLVNVFKLQKFVKKQKGQIYLQPVDTWVRQVAIEVELVSKNAKDNTIKKVIIDTCRKFDVDPIRFNQGAWYIGSNSFKIVLANLSKL